MHPYDVFFNGFAFSRDDRHKVTKPKPQPRPLSARGNPSAQTASECYRMVWSPRPFFSTRSITGCSRLLARMQ